MPVTKEQMTKKLEDIHKMMKENFEAVNDFVAPDAKLLIPHHEAICGKDAILKFHKTKKEEKKDLEMKTTVDDVIEIGDTIIADGKCTVILGGKEIDHGKFMKVFRKDGDNFKLVRSMWNTSKPKDGCA